jgi:response regulator of citrate/malate metabolism
MSSSPIDQFLKTFLSPPPGDTPKEIKERLLHWIAVTNEPQQFSNSEDAHAIAATRRSARQNLKRLAQRHPDIATDLMNERKQGAA